MHDPGDLEALVKLADQRLYDAKHAGRDRLVSEASQPGRSADSNSHA
jgi:PleD family two-component response regulator